MTRVTYSWARAHWGEMLQRISSNSESFVITFRGKEVAMFAPVNDELRRGRDTVYIGIK